MTVLDVIWGVFLGGWIVSTIFWLSDIKKNPEKTFRYVLVMGICAAFMIWISWVNS